MKLSKATMAGLAAVGAIALAVPALAQDESGTPEPSEESTGQQAPLDHRQEKLDRLAQGLAGELDLPVEDVQAALEAVHEQFREERRAQRLERLDQRLDEAVEAGDLTGEQADAILQAAEAGVFPGPGRHHRSPGGPGPGGPGPRG